MCGIFGYIGRESAYDIILKGLKRLEYRGYDSWGIATTNSLDSVQMQLQLDKHTGEIPNPDSNKNKHGFRRNSRHNSQNNERSYKVDDQSNGRNDTSSKVQVQKINSGIGHTRWATHGGVTKANAHPHLSEKYGFAIAHNGIVENFFSLKEILTHEGIEFKSETDTEVILRLIEKNLEESDLDMPQNFSKEGLDINILQNSFINAFNKLEGRNTIILISSKGEILAIKNGSPLVLGQNGDEYFLGSDYLSFANHTKKILEIEDYGGLIISPGKEVSKFSINKETRSIVNSSMKFKTIKENIEIVDKLGFADFMIKEIYEQPKTILDAITYEESDFELLVNQIKSAETIYTIGCGTAAYAAGQIAYFLRKYANIKAIELKGYDTSGYEEIFSKRDIMLAISQSGETADTIAPLELIRSKGGKVASLVNMPGSSITKMSDFAFYSRTGPEICVASTKAFTAQLAWGYLLAGNLLNKSQKAKQDIRELSKIMTSFIDDPDTHREIKKVVNKIKSAEHVFVLGKGQNTYIALEGSLKIKEISYKHFEGFTAGELKHGVIALIEKNTPVFCIVSEDEYKADILSAASELKARGAFIIGVGEVRDIPTFDISINMATKSLANGLDSLMNVLPFQLISYYLGKTLGNNVDKPRNLAKSVTVR